MSERRLSGRERGGGRKAEGYSGRTSPRRHRAACRLAAAVATRNPQLARRSALKGRPAPIRPLVSRPGVGWAGSEMGARIGRGAGDWGEAGQSRPLIGLAW